MLASETRRNSLQSCNGGLTSPNWRCADDRFASTRSHREHFDEGTILSSESLVPISRSRYVLPPSNAIAPYSTPTGLPLARTIPLAGLAHTVGPRPPASISHRMLPSTYAWVSNVNFPTDELEAKRRPLKSWTVVDWVLVLCTGIQTPPRTTVSGPSLKFGY